jgi:hypothetical protein
MYMPGMVTMISTEQFEDEQLLHQPDMAGNDQGNTDVVHVA